jgi:NAD(P)-dependent dehydrogenase (short-subunit alcohol dehydrogenase family)
LTSHPDQSSKGVAIVTGASRVIGASTAKAFAAADAAVALAARDEAALNVLENELSSNGTRAVAVPTDVGDPAPVEDLVRQTVRAFGRLDVAFNNAGGGQLPTPLAELPIEVYDTAIAVTLRGVFLSMKYESPPCSRRVQAPSSTCHPLRVLKQSVASPATCPQSTASPASRERPRWTMPRATCG